MNDIKENGLKITRRQFLGSAAWLTFAVAFAPKGLLLMSEAQAKAANYGVGAWVRISPDNMITILTPGAEMGQGSMTGVPIALAEELDADWGNVRLEWAPADPRKYGYARKRGKSLSYSMAIVGSRAVMMYYKDMRRAGGQVRKVLLQAAAKKWGVDPAELSTEPSVVVHGPSGRRMSYGEVATFAQVPDTMPEISESEFKDKSQFRLIGKPVARRDIPDKVNGSAKFSIDVQLPGMVYASTVHAPVQLAEPKSWNDANVRAMKGVIDIVKLERGVAVVADTFERVLAARKALEVVWAGGAVAEGYDSEKTLDATYPKIAYDKAAKRKTVREKGDVDAAFASTAKVYQADFRSDYGYHAQMEPLNGVARFNAAGDEVEVWEGTQAPGRSRAMIAEALGFNPGQVTHHQQYMGGGFGRRSITDYTVEAALIARAIKRPVKMIWTREEDIAYGMFRPQSYQCVEAALDKGGKVSGWRHCVVGDGGNLIYSGIRIDRYYGIPNQHVEQRGTSHGIRLKHWRAVAHPFNLFAIEGLVDEMAAKEGLDPFEFRRQRMAMPSKAMRVFDAVEKLSDWNTKRPEGRALGLAVTERSGSLGAGVVEISLDRQSGKIRVHRVWVAIDGGTVVQPEMARRNVESGVIYGLSSVLKERATMKGGKVVQSNFHDYEVLRMSEAPEEIHVEFMDRDTKPTGLGEIGNPFIAAAVANAFYALTGKRLYHMPFTPARVLEVLKA
ncbi:MAG: molybdopterin-dependent oxidoreductase [Betaproteobacteria bacterium]|nr:molybdopterin-dependent oxidoreductase [Betaproteobacteria bacterium]MDH3435417.1 molybdopterin-dependent oxidoreductase [Betaproteobacteria bacterium]